MKLNNMMSLAMSAAAASILALCNGGTTEIGNARSEITGSIVDNGKAVDSAEVELVAEDYVPGTAQNDKVFTTRTDCRGDYHIDAVPDGRYYLGAKGAGKRLLRGPIAIDESRDLAVDELKPVSKMTVSVPQGWIAGEVFIKGATQTWTVTSGSAILDSLPPGEVTVVAYVKSDPAYYSVDKQTTLELTVGVTPSEVAVASFGNAPPQLMSAQTTLAYVAGSADTVSFDVRANDPEGLPVSYSIESGPAGMSVDSTTGAVEWQTAGKPAGDYFATVKIADAGGAYRTVQLTMTVASATYSVEYKPKVDTLILDKTGWTRRTYLYTAEKLLAGGTVTAWRFAWGDGDTTTWQDSPEAAHVWKSAGRYAVQFQVQFQEDGSFSAWSQPQWIQISENIDDTPPVITLLGGDTVRIPFGDPNSMIALYADQVKVVDDVSGELIPYEIETNIEIFVVGGPYTMIYRAIDLAGNGATAVRYVFITADDIRDVTPPVITLKGADTVKVPDSVTMSAFIGSYEDAGATAIDNVDGDISNKIRVGDFTQLNGKLWYITFDVTDAAGNAAPTVKRMFETSKSTIIVPPILDLAFPDSTIHIVLGNTWVEPGYIASDVVDGDLTSKVVVDSANLIANINKIGTYTVTYRVTNSNNLIATKQRTVKVVDPSSDTTPPVLSLFGGDTIFCTDTMDVGIFVSIFRDPGYSVFDNRDEVDVDSVLVGFEQLSQWMGYLNYRVQDLAGNVATASRLVVTAVDPNTVSPRLELIGNRNIEYYLSQPANSIDWDEPGFSAYDPIDGDLTGRDIVGDTIGLRARLAVPGKYRIQYSVTNSRRSTVVAFRFFTVYQNYNTNDSIPPVITLRGRNPDTVVIGSDSWYVDPGATAVDNLTDSMDGRITITGYVDIGKIGKHTLTYSVADIAGNIARAERIVYVVKDTGVGPSSDSLTITLNGDNPDTVFMWSYPYDTAYIDPGATAIDPVLGNITSRMTVSGVVDVNKPGVYTRVYTVEGSQMGMEAWRTVVVRIPPDDTSGMRSKYGVPMNSRLPTIRGIYELQQVDGDTLNLGNVKAFKMMMDPATQSLTNLQLYKITGSDTVYVNIRDSLLHLFDTDQPAFLISHSGIPDLDGPYLVRADATMMYWVAFSGRVTLVWRKVVFFD